jgi:hypothetical protein
MGLVQLRLTEELYANPRISEEAAIRYNPDTFPRELLNYLNIAQRGWSEGVRLESAKEGLHLIDLFRKTEPDPQTVKDQTPAVHGSGKYPNGEDKRIARGEKHRIMAKFYEQRLRIEEVNNSKIRLAYPSSS